MGTKRKSLKKAENPRKNLGIRASQERWEKINRIAYARQTSIQKLIDEAIDGHLLGKRRMVNNLQLLGALDRSQLEPVLVRAVDCIAELVQLCGPDVVLSDQVKEVLKRA